MFILSQQFLSFIADFRACRLYHQMLSFHRLIPPPFLQRNFFISSQHSKSQAKNGCWSSRWAPCSTLISAMPFHQKTPKNTVRESRFLLPKAVRQDATSVRLRRSTANTIATENLILCSMKSASHQPAVSHYCNFSICHQTFVQDLSIKSKLIWSCWIR